MKIKICGITTQEEITALNACQPDYVGFVFAQSKRMVTSSAAKPLITTLDRCILSVGVFVDESADKIIDIVDACGLDLVQLHGAENEETISELIKLMNLRNGKIIQTIKCVPTKDETSILRGIETKADFIIFDTFDKTQHGGTGRTANLALINKIRPSITKPFFIAGGISPDNLSAIELNPYGIDVSTGVEGENGKKDANLITRLIKAAKAVY